MSEQEKQVRYAYSTDGENYGYADFEHVEAACKEAAVEVGAGGTFWVGELCSPTQPEDWWCAEDWLEHVSCQDAYRGDHAEDWDTSSDAQRSELEEEVRKVMAAWLDRHDLRPAFFNIREPRKFRVIADAEGGLRVEEVAARKERAK